MNNDTTSLVKSENSSGLVSKGHLTEVNASRQLLVNYVRGEMKRGVDYDTIPGCGDKPTLLKPGAEKLAQLFGLRSRIAKCDKTIDLKGNFVQFDYTVEVYSLRTGGIWGQCEGTCTNMERKFKSRDAADMMNTIMKMSQKRAYVGAVIQATSASEFFTQDIEDGNAIEGEYREHAPSNGNGHTHNTISGDPGDYVCTLKRYAGQKIRDIKPDLIQSYCQWLQKEATSKKEPLRNGALDLVNNWQKYVARNGKFWQDPEAGSAESAAADAVDKM